METVAVALVCKTPQAGRSKTRLSPPLTPQQCADLSAAFIRDVAAIMHDTAQDSGAANYAVYTPAGSGAELRTLLTPDFRLLPQADGDLGARLTAAMHTLFARGHRRLIFVNADGPTLPLSILRDAVRIVAEGGHVIGPALDGGYTLIGLQSAVPDLFKDIAWSTPRVFEQTRSKAVRLGLTLLELPLWYDVDDSASLAILQTELAGGTLPFAHGGLVGSPALATRAAMRHIHLDGQGPSGRHNLR